MRLHPTLTLPLPPCPATPQGVVADGFGQLGERAEAVSKLCSSSSASLASSFEAPLKEFVRTVAVSWWWWWCLMGVPALLLFRMRLLSSRQEGGRRCCGPAGQCCNQMVLPWAHAAQAAKKVMADRSAALQAYQQVGTGRSCRLHYCPTLTGAEQQPTNLQ